MNIIKEQAYEKIKQLVDRFSEHVEEYKRISYNEHQTRGGAANGIPAYGAKFFNTLSVRGIRHRRSGFVTSKVTPGSQNTS